LQVEKSFPGLLFYPFPGEREGKGKKRELQNEDVLVGVVVSKSSEKWC